ncbi:hypothetical protein [Deinococcus ficus]|uniref:Uncharacterized protein n=1 Tax=Deinococcus ficus TaxID=317577 RepID=A0A221SW64_9DEIO|nr:hypothetical protein [Deinococcus ficus]ASN80878.1 hypothetical protein DFI_07595 [Deinococcus ficus]
MPPSAAWKARLIALPGVLTLLSLLAVVLGSQPPAPDTAPRMTAGAVMPSLPELRATPAPAPAVPLLTGTPPESFRLSSAARELGAALRPWTDPVRAPDLRVLGRRQTDGG